MQFFESNFFVILAAAAAFYAVAAFCDINSNKTGIEANSVLRGADGRIDIKKAVFWKTVIGMALAGICFVPFFRAFGFLGLACAAALQMLIAWENTRINSRRREAMKNKI